MKILLITNRLSFSSGWERYSRDLAESLNESGHEVFVLCQEYGQDSFEIEQKKAMPDPLSYWRNYFLFYLPVLKNLFFLVKKKPDVIHCLIETYLPTAWLLSFVLRRPLVATVHGSFGLKPLAFKLIGAIQKKVYHATKKIICISHHTQDRLLSKVPDLDNIKIIPNGIYIKNNMMLNNIRSSFSDHPVLLGVGALKQRKGFHLVIESLPKVLKIFPGLKYWIVGSQKDIHYVSALRARIKELGLINHVEFFENISDKKLNDLYNQANIFVLTPVSDEYNFEGFGLVYLEANVRGLPVVGMLGNGGEDAIKSGVSGFLAKAGNVSDISGIIISILSNDVLYNRLSKSSILWAQEFNWSKIVMKYIETYKDCYVSEKFFT